MPRSYLAKRRAWSIVSSAGLPDDAIRPPPRVLPPASSLRDALKTLARVRLSTREQELVLSWLSGWEHHWPQRFATMVGSDGTRLLARLRTSDLDPNRCLKLRRIAIENLSRIA
jgi:hypothetical protein